MRYGRIRGEPFVSIREKAFEMTQRDPTPAELVAFVRERYLEAMIASVPVLYVEQSRRMFSFLLTVLERPPQEEKDDAVTRSERLDVQPPPQPAAANQNAAEQRLRELCGFTGNGYLAKWQWAALVSAFASRIQSPVYVCHCCGLTLSRALCAECGVDIFGLSIALESATPDPAIGKSKDESPPIGSAPETSSSPVPLPDAAPSPTVISRHVPSVPCGHETDGTASLASPPGKEQEERK